MNYVLEFIGERSKWAHHDSLKLRRSLKVTEHLGGETVQRRNRRHSCSILCIALPGGN
jgi:hypothetical protein